MRSLEGEKLRVREGMRGLPEEDVDDVDHVVADAAIAQRGEHRGELAAGLLLVVQRVEHRQADGVLLGGLCVRASERRKARWGLR